MRMRLPRFAKVIDKVLTESSILVSTYRASKGGSYERQQ